MLIAFGGLGVALQTEPQRPQHSRHRPIRDRMPHRGQRPGQVTGRLGRPHQQRHRIPTRLGVHQRLQARHQFRIGLGQPLAATASGPHPNSGLRVARQLPNPPCDGVRMSTRRLRDSLDPTPPQLGSLRTQQQPTLPLIQMPA